MYSFSWLLYYNSGQVKDPHVRGSLYAVCPPAQRAGPMLIPRASATPHLLMLRVLLLVQSLAKVSYARV